jgi:hypothetical protein
MLVLVPHRLRVFSSGGLNSVSDDPALRASLETPFSRGISIFLWEISSFFLGKMKIHWEKVVPKLTLNIICFTGTIVY